MSQALKGVMDIQFYKQLSDQKFALDQAAIVASTDQKGLITYVNEKFCKISGFSESELLGRTHHIVNSGYHSSEFFENLWKTISSGQVWSGEICNRKKNGDIYWVSTTIVPFLGNDGKPEQYLSIRHEITELKLAQKTILEQNEKLVASSRLSAIGEMAAAITHEINNPLGVILGRVEMLKSMLSEQQLDAKELLRIANTIETTGYRIEKIVKSMRSMSHQQSDREPFERVMISEIIEDALNWCQNRFLDHGVRLIKPEVINKTRVECRSYQIVQVLVNLLNNAYDAIQNLDEKWIRIEVSENEDDVVIEITDSGSGISNDTQSKMFDPFYSTKKVQFGTGLGLSISKSLLMQNGGNLLYDSKSQNTKFLMHVPKKQK
jgi:PAS domain S-box-containing protein